MLLAVKFLFGKMPQAPPRAISSHEGQQGIATNIFVWLILLFLFFFNPSFPLVLDCFHLPLSLEHCLTVHLFSLCMFSLPPYVYFCKQTVVFIQLPLVFFGFLSSSNILSSFPIPSAYLPSWSATGVLFPIRFVLSCLLDFSPPLC